MLDVRRNGPGERYQPLRPSVEKVRQKMTDLGLSYVVHNPRLAEGGVRNDQTHAQLLELGGEDQIPYLIDNNRGEALYESDDIVDYLDEHYA